MPRMNRDSPSRPILNSNLCMFFAAMKVSDDRSFPYMLSGADTPSNPSAFCKTIRTH